MTPQTRIVQVRQQLLKRNDLAARALRRRFEHAGVLVISLVSSPGAGKTKWLEEMLARLGQTQRVAAVVGDLATDNDAQRLARSGAPVRQITTGAVCHLEAEMVEQAIANWTLEELDVLFIENVGNLVCPASYDLGERIRIVLFSVTEGEDKPLKYPTIFNTADLCVITKIDLADAVGFDRAAAYRSIHSVSPQMEIFELSAKTGKGMDEMTEWMTSQRAAAATAAPELTATHP